MRLQEAFGSIFFHAVGGVANGSRVPLARRNVLADKRRLARSAAGIAFAVLLMMVELGFRSAFIESMLLAMRQLDGDIMLVSATKYQFDRRAPFSRRQLYEARSVPGVDTAGPVYVERILSVWKNPQNHRLFAVLVFAFDPDQPVFLLPEVADKLDALRQPDTVMVDRRARSVLGVASTGTETELARRRVRVVGTFWLGPNFFTDGNLIMSDRNFHKLLGGGSPDSTDLPDIEVGVIKVLPGHDVVQVQQAIRAALPANVAVLTKDELIDRERRFHASVSPVGPIFNVGTLVGFAVGIMICYQILFSELSDQLSQYATLKAMGYPDRFLTNVVLQQAVFYALVGYGPAWILCFLLFRLLSDVVLLPMGMTADLTAISLALTLVMCIAAALIAVRRVIAADPADVF
jgi:putative ABC transport system permease protein